MLSENARGQRVSVVPLLIADEIEQSKSRAEQLIQYVLNSNMVELSENEELLDWLYQKEDISNNKARESRISNHEPFRIAKQYDLFTACKEFYAQRGHDTYVFVEPLRESNKLKYKLSDLFMLAETRIGSKKIILDVPYQIQIDINSESKQSSYRFTQTDINKLDENIRTGFTFPCFSRAIPETEPTTLELLEQLEILFTIDKSLASMILTRTLQPIISYNQLNYFHGLLNKILIYDFEQQKLKYTSVSKWLDWFKQELAEYTKSSKVGTLSLNDTFALSFIIDGYYIARELKYRFNSARTKPSLKLLIYELLNSYVVKPIKALADNSNREHPDILNHFKSIQSILFSSISVFLNNGLSGLSTILTHDSRWIIGLSIGEIVSNGMQIYKLTDSILSTASNPSI